jgi:hypothetical protein
MSENIHKPCYGAMFPSTLKFANDKPSRGKVFAFELLTAGGTFRSGRRVSHHLSEWDDCLDCPEFEHCYKLCVGRLALETAIGQR